MPEISFDLSRFDVNSIEEIAAFADVTHQAIHEWVKIGCPRRQISPRKYVYNAAELFRWYRTLGPGGRSEKRKKNGQATIPFSGEDEALYSDDEHTPALERWRLSRAKISELEYETKVGALVPLAEGIEKFSGMAGHLRRKGEEAARRFGTEVQRFWNDSVAEFIDILITQCGDTAAQGLAAESESPVPADSGTGVSSDSAPDQPMGGGGNHRSDGSKAGAVSTPEPSCEQTVVPTVGDGPMVENGSCSPNTDRQDSDGLRDSGSVPPV